MQSDEAHRVIKHITSASGNSKQTILKEHPDIQPYLLAAYDPYTRYYITKGVEGVGVNQFDFFTWKILKELSDRKLSGDEAKWIDGDHTRRMSARSSELFRMILKKDLRMGMGAKTINKVFPGLIPTHDVMLAKLFENNRVKYPCWGSPKIDGVRAKLKNGKFYSRNGHPYIGLNHLQDQLEGITSELDGELTVVGRTFQEGSGLIRSDNPTPNAQFHIIDLPTINDNFHTRLMLMDDLHNTGPSVFKVKHVLLQNEGQLQQYYGACRKAGYEGAVIKPFDYEYKGSRSYSWMKMKPSETVDLHVINIYEGKGKYQDQMGGVEVMFNGKINRVGSGWSDIQRKIFYNYPYQVIGKVIEVSYMEETDDGNMRHSRFERFRPDKED